MSCAKVKVLKLEKQLQGPAENRERHWLTDCNTAQATQTEMRQK